MRVLDKVPLSTWCKNNNNGAADAEEELPLHCYSVFPLSCSMCALFMDLLLKLSPFLLLHFLPLCNLFLADLEHSCKTTLFPPSYSFATKAVALDISIC